MNFTKTPISGAFEIKLIPISDQRGVFSRLFCSDEFHEIGFYKQIVQINQSYNRIKGTIRGMHFQYPPFAEDKIIKCLRGVVYDVLIDLRKNSPTFLKWHAIELSPEMNNMVLIPPGCAHGFQTLTENSELLYFHTEYYNPKSEGAIRFDDQRIGIHWPIDVSNVSEKDRTYPLLDSSFDGITLKNQF